MNKTFTCIICPNSCDISAEVCDGKISNICGNLCAKGIKYVKNEVERPMRNFATSVIVSGGEFELCSVRLSAPIPKSRIFDVLKEIKNLRLTAPIAIGQPLIKNVLGLGSDVISTREVNIRPQR